MPVRSVVSPHDQNATFVELFFDLVFVFCVTQVTELLHADPTPAGAGRALLAFWLVWWAWTQFTWTLNAADTTHPLVELATLVATGIAFFMAVAIPRAFEGGGLAFALPYALVRLTGLALHAWVAGADPSMRRAVATFWLGSTAGLAAVLLGGAMEDEVRLALWGLTLVLDLAAAGWGGSSEGWNLHPEHFAERHGLIVIIALGESLIVAAAGLSGVGPEGPTLAVGVLAVLFSCALWWTYFPRAKPRLAGALAAARGSRQSRMARDAYSLLHFPMLLGVIAGATALGEAIAHPAEPLAPHGRVALAAGLFLFVGGTGAALRRAGVGGSGARIVLAGAGAAAVLLMPAMAAWGSLGVAAAGAALVAVVEERVSGEAPGS